MVLPDQIMCLRIISVLQAAQKCELQLSPRTKTSNNLVKAQCNLSSQNQRVPDLYFMCKEQEFLNPKKYSRTQFKQVCREKL